MKKLFYLFVAAVLFVGVQSCEQKEETVTEETTTEEVTEEAAPVEEVAPDTAVTDTVAPM